MQEMIAAVDPHSGEVVGAVGKDDAHRDDVWHATIHVWIVDDESRILLQQRSYEKQHFPGMWDISAAGHIAPGEDGTREVAEELGAHSLRRLSVQWRATGYARDGYPVLDHQLANSRISIRSISLLEAQNRIA